MEGEICVLVGVKSEKPEWLFQDGKWDERVKYLIVEEKMGKIWELEGIEDPKRWDKLRLPLRIKVKSMLYKDEIGGVMTGLYEESVEVCEKLLRR